MSSRISVVTGASRGVGAGVARGLGRCGDTVHLSGRDRAGLARTAAAVDAAGGRGVAVVTDHGDDASSAAFFESVRAESGSIDLLVVNAAAISPALVGRTPFWQRPLELADILHTGLRSHYVTCHQAAPLMIERGGLIVLTSSPGGRCYMHGPAYGAQKAGSDKLAHDMAVDLRPYGVTVVSLWLGVQLTDQLRATAAADPDASAAMVAMAESTDFTAAVVDALARDPDRSRFTGRTVYAAELAADLQITEADGRAPASHRDWLGDPPTFSDAVVR